VQTVPITCLFWCLLVACLQGYTAEWSQNGTQLTCTPKKTSLSSTAIMAIAASAAGALLLAAVALLVWLRLTVQLRPRWQREKELLANRKKGVPCDAPASIVVTDIEHYSALMKINPQLTTKALGVLRTHVVLCFSLSPFKVSFHSSQTAKQNG
jgi:hypothetical protein